MTPLITALGSVHRPNLGTARGRTVWDPRTVRSRVYLPKAVSVTDLSGLGGRFKIGLDEFMRQAGLDYRMTPSGRVRVRALPPEPMVELRPLQRDDGTFREDASSLLSEGAPPSALSYGSVVRDGLARTRTTFESLGGWPRIELAWLAAPDPLAEARKFHAARPEVRLWVVRGSQRLRWRLAFWRMCDQLIDGVPTGAVLPGAGLADGALVNGLLEAAPGSFVCAPLLARPQPLAALLTTSRGTQVVATLASGMFERPLRVGEWPTGIGDPSFYAPDAPVYSSEVTTFPHGFAATYLRKCVDGANSLLDFLTDPSNWADTTDTFLPEERWAAWASTRWGLAAITNLADSWGSSENIWTAFRALTTLAEMWSCRLQDLVNPNRLRLAAGVFPEPLSTWTNDVIGNYRDDICRAFGSKVDSAAWKVAELRNLVHGVVADDSGDRYRRLRLLVAVGRQRPALQFVADLAVIWWSAVLLDPSRFSPTGPAPWIGERS